MIEEGSGHQKQFWRKQVLGQYLDLSPMLFLAQ